MGKQPAGMHTGKVSQRARADQRSEGQGGKGGGGKWGERAREASGVWRGKGGHQVLSHEVPSVVQVVYARYL